MAKLIFRKFRCDIDTDEIGGDSPCAAPRP